VPPDRRRCILGPANNWSAAWHFSKAAVTGVQIEANTKSFISPHEFDRTIGRRLAEHPAESDKRHNLDKQNGLRRRDRKRFSSHRRNRDETNRRRRREGLRKTILISRTRKCEHAKDQTLAIKPSLAGSFLYWRRRFLVSVGTFQLSRSS
jgi:hypothetical protein